MAKQIRAAIYCRVSTEEQAREGFSIAAQKKILTSFSIDRGWIITKEYVDEGISGKSTKRPAFQQLLRDAACKKFDTVLVWKINRFSRRNADLLNTAEYLNEIGINLISCSEQFDASTASGKLMLSMLGSIGEFERDTIIENIRAGMNERARQGLFNGGRVLGYDIISGNLVVNEGEASTVRRIYELYLSGVNMANICRILKHEGRTTKNGCTFSISSVKRILTCPIYAGYISYNSPVSGGDDTAALIYRGKHIPLVSQQQYETVKKALASKYMYHARCNSYILSGILRCPGCGSAMTGHSIGKYRYYVCINYKNNGRSACSSHSINASAAENQILDHIFPIICAPPVVNEVYNRIIRMNAIKSSTASNEIPQTAREISSLKKSASKYIILFENNEVDINMLTSRVREINSQIEVLEKRYSELEKNLKSSTINMGRVRDAIMYLCQAFRNLDNSIQKRLVSSIVNRAAVTKENGIEYIMLNFHALAKKNPRYTGDNVKRDINTGDS